MAQKAKIKEKTHLAVHEQRLPASDGAVRGDGGAGEEKVKKTEQKKWSQGSVLSRKKRRSETKRLTGCGREGEPSRCASSGRRGSLDPGKRERSGLKRCQTSVLLRSDEKKKKKTHKQLRGRR
jgi:hypothetical protein